MNRHSEYQARDRAPPPAMVNDSALLEEDEEPELMWPATLTPAEAQAEGKKTALRRASSRLPRPPAPAPPMKPGAPRTEAGSKQAVANEEKHEDDDDNKTAPPPPPRTTTGDVEAAREPDIYDRFPPQKKRWIVAVVSFSAFIGPVASSAFLPSISVMAKDLNTTPAVINYTVAIFIIAVGVAPIFWSPLSGFYGRRPVYLMSMPIMTVASIGVAESRTVAQLIGTRILQGIGSSCVLSVGAGTVGDIYRPTERANAMSWFYSGVLVGPACAPVIAGIFTEYTAITWRATQYFLCATSALAVILVALFLPETSHPVLPHDKAKEATGKKFVMYWFNPVKSLGLMRFPNIVAVTTASSFIMLMTYMIMVPMATIFQDRYNLDNTALAGCVYLSTGIGTMIGSRIAGPSADRIVRTWLKKRGYRRPEDRLRAALLGAGLITPATALIYGWLLWANKGGIWPPLVILVINGIGMQLSLTPLNTYLVDAVQGRSAEAIAVNNFWRYILSAAGSAFVLPMIDAIGLGWTMTVGAVLGWLGFGAIVATLVWGERWREAVGSKEMTVSEEKEQEADGGRAPDSELEVKASDVKEARRPSASSDHSHGEAEHGEPTHLVSALDRQRTRTARRPRAASGTGAYSLTRERTRRGSTASTMPSVGEVLQRTVSLSGVSVHGGG